MKNYDFLDKIFKIKCKEKVSSLRDFFKEATVVCYRYLCMYFVHRKIKLLTVRNNFQRDIVEDIRTKKNSIFLL